MSDDAASTLAVVLGFLANQGVFLTRVLLWAESLAEILFVMRHRAAYEDISQQEQSGGAERAQPDHENRDPKAASGIKTQKKVHQDQRSSAGEKEKRARTAISSPKAKVWRCGLSNL